MEIYRDELYHSGVVGMKWGVRRYQNEDGTLTPAGKRRYAKSLTKRLNTFEEQKAYAIGRNNSAKYVIKWNKDKMRYSTSKREDDMRKELDRNQKKILKTSIENMEKAEKEVQSILRKAKKEGLTVESKPVKRYTDETAKNLARTGAIVGGISSTITGITFATPFALVVGAAGAGAGYGIAKKVESYETSLGMPWKTYSKQWNVSYKQRN